MFPCQIQLGAGVLTICVIVSENLLSWQRMVQCLRIGLVQCECKNWKTIKLI